MAYLLNCCNGMKSKMSMVGQVLLSSFGTFCGHSVYAAIVCGVMDNNVGHSKIEIYARRARVDQAQSTSATRKKHLIFVGLMLEFHPPCLFADLEKIRLSVLFVDIKYRKYVDFC